MVPRKDFHEVEYFHKVECTGNWFTKMKQKMDFNKTSLTNLLVDSAVCLAMGLYKIIYLRNTLVCGGY